MFHGKDTYFKQIETTQLKASSFAWRFLVVKFSLNLTTSAFHHIQSFKMIKFCHDRKTGYLIAIGFEKPKSKDFWSNIFYQNWFANCPKHCEDKCAILELWWNLLQYANGFKSHSRLKQKANLMLHQFLTKGCKSLCWWGWSLVSLCIKTLIHSFFQ